MSDRYQIFETNIQFKKVKKIASSKRTNRFAQTDFTYEDLRTENFSAYTYTKLADAKVQDKDCFVIEAKPKEPATSGYAKRHIYVEKARYLTYKIVFFDKKERKLKTLESRGYEDDSFLLSGLQEAIELRVLQHEAEQR